MNSFQALGTVQQATISMVAPGISEALVATAMGLFAAIPAVIAYNRYADKVARLEIRYDGFMEEFSSILQRYSVTQKEVWYVLTDAKAKIDRRDKRCTVHRCHACIATSFYDNSAWGISFSVNDDLSVSYGTHESEKGMMTGSTTNVTTKATSLQMSYSMGGASIKIAETSVDNGSYTSTTTFDRDGTTVALSLAF